MNIQPIIRIVTMFILQLIKFKFKCTLMAIALQINLKVLRSTFSILFTWTSVIYSYNVTGVRQYDILELLLLLNANSSISGEVNQLNKNKNANFFSLCLEN